MSWNHRVMKTTVKSVSGYTEEVYGIHEVYYNEDGKPTSWTKRAVEVVGDNVEDLRWVLQKMLESLDKPVLDNGEIRSKIINRKQSSEFVNEED